MFSAKDRTVDHVHESSMYDSESEPLPEPNPEAEMPGLTDDTFGLTPRPRAKTRLVDPLLGVDLGGVKIVRLIGEGGMGRVYEAVQERPSRTVAVKIIRQGILTEKTLRRFEREADFLARLQHPGIARIFIVGTYSSDVGEIPFYVMEYLADAKPITHYVDELSLSVTDRLRLFQQVCQAVSHGHDRGIVHRDLKPGNILIDNTGQPKVIDFGVARSTDSDLALTSMRTDTGQLIGTVQYMSPEQFGAEPDDLDARADVYALGVVLYEILAGEPPYQVKRKGIHEAAKVVCEQSPTPLRAHDKTLPREIEAITHRCLQKDRRKRYRTAGALAHDIELFLAGKPISTQPTSTVVDFLLAPWRAVQRRRALLAGLFIGVAVAAVAVFLGRSFFTRPEAPESPDALAARVKRETQAPLDPAGFAAQRGDSASIQAAHANLRLTTDWVASQFRVERGACYRLRVSGDFRDDVGAIVGPEGRAPEDQRALIGPRDGLTRAQLQAGFVNGYPRFGVISRVGSDSVTLFVGRELAFIAPESGELSFRLNEFPSKASAASGEAQFELESVTSPEFVTAGGETALCARVAGEEFLVFEPDGLRWRRNVFGRRPEQEFPVLINGIAWWPDRFDPVTSALLKTPEFAWASGPDGLRPVVQTSAGMSPAARTEPLEIKPGLHGLAFRWHGDGESSVSCTIARPTGNGGRSENQDKKGE